MQNSALENVRPLVVSADICAKMLQIHRDDIYRLIEKGQLPSIRIGRRVRIPVKAIEEMIDQALAS